MVNMRESWTDERQFDEALFAVVVLNSVISVCVSTLTLIVTRT